MCAKDAAKSNYVIRGKLCGDKLEAFEMSRLSSNLSLSKMTSLNPSMLTCSSSSIPLVMFSSSSIAPADYSSYPTKCGSILSIQAEYHVGKVNHENS